MSILATQSSSKRSSQECQFICEPFLKEYTILEYLELEEKALEKSEYENGRIIGMSGGTIDHGLICTNVSNALGKAIEEKNLACTPANSEVRVYIEASNSFVYPDGMLLCGEIEIAEQDPHSVTNPALVVEVLSKSTERYDRGDKFHKYCALPSFRGYVLIDAKKPVVDVLYREGHASWKMVTTIGLDKSIYLHTLDAQVAMTDLYKNTIELGPVSFEREEA